MKNYLDYFKEYYKKYPERIKAHQLINKALNNGTLRKPLKCEECNKEKQLLGHHEDYSKPLEVNWLCYSCHTKLHNKKREN